MQIKYIFILAMLGGYSYAATNQINLKTKNDTIIKLRNVNAQGVTKLDAAIELKAKVEKQAIKQSQSSTLGDLLRHVSGGARHLFWSECGGANDSQFERKSCATFK